MQEYIETTETGKASAWFYLYFYFNVCYFVLLNQFLFCKQIICLLLLLLVFCNTQAKLWTKVFFTSKIGLDNVHYYCVVKVIQQTQKWLLYGQHIK